jgi:hypothetical protein
MCGTLPDYKTSNRQRFLLSNILLFPDTVAPRSAEVEVGANPAIVMHH